MASYQLNELNEKSIFEIRAIAKEVGVSAPTKMNKAELVDLIYKISNGKMDPPSAPRRGRPKKETEQNKPKAEDKRLNVQFHSVSGLSVDANDKESFSSGKKLSENQASAEEQIREGYLEINPDGYGFLRVRNGEFNEMDAYVASVKIKQYDLRRGDYVKASCKLIQEGRPSAVVSVLTINGEDVKSMHKRPNFDDLVPIYPDERIRLELPSNPREYATR